MLRQLFQYAKTQLQGRTSEALHLVREAPTLVRTRSEEEQVRQALADTLHTYPRKELWIARLIWLTTGYVGGHRFYLGYPASGAAMAFTLGGCLFWWIADGFKLNALTEKINTRQAEREAEGLPPLGMEFLPKVHPDVLDTLPPWAQPDPADLGTRLRRMLPELIWAGLVGALMARIAGDMAVDVKFLAPVYAIVALLVVVNFSRELVPWYHLPVVHELLQWEFRLRLFYYHHKPGHPFALFWRITYGLFTALFSQKARTEVKLYLAISGVFAAGANMHKVFSGQLWQAVTTFQIGNFIGSQLEDQVKGLVVGGFMVYCLTAVIGATLIKQVLLGRPRWVRLVLSLVIGYALYKGLIST
ncbi:MAG: TM2 domain-containing protein [Bacteroidia bacterium]|nr:TM2 domain-containing protein [Bacteroidia bacterium]